MSHCQCPYTRPPLAKPSNVQFSPISGPPPQAELCLNKLLMHLVSLNGTLQHTLEDHNPIPSEPSSPTTNSSIPSIYQVHALHQAVQMLSHSQRVQVANQQFQWLVIGSYAPASQSVTTRPS